MLTGDDLMSADWRGIVLAFDVARPEARQVGMPHLVVTDRDPAAVREALLGDATCLVRTAPGRSALVCLLR